MIGGAPAALVALLAAAFATGCAGGKDAADRQIDRLRTDIMRLESDQDRLSSRLTAIEMSGKSTPTATAQASASASTTVLAPAAGDRPALRVVVLKPGEELPPSTETDTTDEGSASGTVRATRELDEVGDADRSAKGKSGSKAKAKKAKLSAAKEYDEAYALVKAKDYEKAIPAMTGFLVRFPDHPNADAAMFWMGASHAAKGDLPQAIEIFEGVLARFPTGNKAPDALLELSRAFRKQGDVERADQVLARLRREFPRSDAASRAPKS